MARKLPWLAQRTSESTKANVKRATSTVSKREEDGNNQRPTTPEPLNQRPRKRVNSRSPSTSPIQPPSQPIPNIEPMHPGLQGDDIYIMVEDEFEATARQFTAHLHAAEYARLKRKAREQPPKAPPDISPSMPRRTQQDIERRHLLSRQNTTLSNLGKRGREEDESDAESEEDKIDDPWRGTSLAGLMGEGSQVKTSLVGLHRVNSETRAARGFGRGDTQESVRSEKKTIDEIFANGRAYSRAVVGDNEVVRATDGRGQKDNNSMIGFDGLDEGLDRKKIRGSAIESDVIVSSRKDRTVARGMLKRNEEDEQPQRIKQEKTQPSSATIRSSANASTTRRSRFHDFDTSDNDTSGIRSSLHSRKKTPAVSSASRKVDVKKDRKSRLDEVPVFLV